MDKQQVRDELDKLYRKDLAKVLGTPEGRRVFSYLLMDCGYRESCPMGNSKDIFNAGRRHVAVQLTFAADSIDFPKRTTGMELRLLAEKEYTELKLAIYDDLVKKERRMRDAK